MPIGDSLPLLNDVMFNEGWQQIAVMRDCMAELDFENNLKDWDLWSVERAREEWGGKGYSSPLISQLNDDADQRYSISKHPIDKNLTAYQRAYKHFNVVDKNAFKEIRENLLSTMEKAVQNDLKGKGIGLYKRYDDKRLNDRLKLYNDIFKLKFGKLGFEKSKKISKPKSPFYSMNIIDDWYIGFYLDNGIIAKVDDVFLRSASNDISLVIMNGEVDMGDWYQQTYFKSVFLACCFPINGEQFSSYQRFKNLAELEINLLAFFEMYSFIHNDLVSILRKFLSSWP